MKTKILLIGSSGITRMVPPIGGQVNKNSTFLTYLKKCSVSYKHIDTIDWRRHLFSILVRVFYELLLGNYSHVITSLAGMSAVRTLKLLTAMKSSLGFKLYHMVIGGNIVDRIQGVHSFRNSLLRCDGIFVESVTVAKQMTALGFWKTSYVPNFKYYSFTPSSKAKAHEFRLVFFSRVCREKGVELAIEAVNALSENYSVQLDIYGPIQPDYREHFESLVSSSSSVDYMGILKPDSDETYEVLSSYDLMLFPTFHEGEGFPGAVIDAYISGLPVIASDWKYNSEIIIEGVTGWLVPPKDVHSLEVAIENAIKNGDSLAGMRLNCVQEAKKYHVDSVLPKLLNEIGITMKID